MVIIPLYESGIWSIFVIENHEKSTYKELRIAISYVHLFISIKNINRISGVSKTIWFAISSMVQLFKTRIKTKPNLTTNSHCNYAAFDETLASSTQRFYNVEILQQCSAPSYISIPSQRNSVTQRKCRWWIGNLKEVWQNHTTALDSSGTLSLCPEQHYQTMD